jgi:AcrR family transcriptional regulator
MKYVEPSKSRRVGRPLSFDRGIALQKAMLLFWRSGYEATSINDLTMAMGITAPSIYGAFGDKKSLFLESVDTYLSGPVTSQSIIENAATAKDAARGLLDAAVIGFTGDDTPRGCLLASAAISCSPAAADVQAALSVKRLKIEKLLEDKILTAIQSGELDGSQSAQALAGHIMAVIQGLSTLARDGADRKKLADVAVVAMNGWN